MGDILAHFPAGKTPRAQQRELLLMLEANWNKGELFILEMPTGSGKSAVAITIAAWLAKSKKEYSAILTPNNLLTEQYNKDYPKLAAYYGRAFYKCTSKTGGTCNSHVEETKKFCTDCPYVKSHKRFRLPYPFNYVTNFYKYVQLKSQFKETAGKSTLIIDEAHLLIDSIKSFNTTHLWKHKFDYTKCKDRYELITALDKTKHTLEGENVYEKYISKLKMDPPRYILKETEDWYKEYNHEEKVWDSKLVPQLEFQPVNIKGLPNPIITDNTKKVILMSATISSKDIEELGLQGLRKVYIKADSPIPAQNRPVILETEFKLNAATLKTETMRMSERIKEIAALNPNSKGLIHATYSQAALLRPLLPDSRYLFHDKDNKKEIYTKFKEAEEPYILVASGMYEGIDLPYDDGRWQVVAKVPYPSLGEPAIKYQVSINKEWYQWQTIKTVLQAAGRICRAPDDYGITYILDGTFLNLYTNYSGLFPEWFTEAVVIKGGTGEE